MCGWWSRRWWWISRVSCGVADLGTFFIAHRVPVTRWDAMCTLPNVPEMLAYTAVSGPPSPMTLPNV